MANQNQLFDTRQLSRTDDGSASPRRRSLVPPRRNPHLLTHHQFVIGIGDLFAVSIYNKDRPYIHAIYVNIKGCDIEKADAVINSGDTIYKFERLGDHRYYIDVYRQKTHIGGIESTRARFTDATRSEISVDGIMANLKCELVSRQEYKTPHIGGVSLHLGGTSLSSSSISGHFV
jgi:hypothetical protein